MQHHRQTPSACLAYALLQIGAVDRAAVSLYEYIIAKGDLSSATINDWCKFVGLGDQINTSWNEPPARGTEPLSGKGIAIIDLTNASGDRKLHAVSYENGLILDPDWDVGKLETFEELKARLRTREEGGWQVELISINAVPIPARRNIEE